MVCYAAFEAILRVVIRVQHRATMVARWQVGHDGPWTGHCSLSQSVRKDIPQQKSMPKAVRSCHKVLKCNYSNEWFRWWERQDEQEDHECEVVHDDCDAQALDFDGDEDIHQLTTLGLLKRFNDEFFIWFELQHLKFLHENLTIHWPDLQKGHSDETMDRLAFIFDVTELDRKARMDFMLLYQTGIVGRTCANKLLWLLMSTWAVGPEYKDISCKVSSEALTFRKSFERPPRWHSDNNDWTWIRLEVPDRRLLMWCPLSVP